MRADRVPPHERGVALLTVLLLVAVIATIAGAALERLRLATRTTGNVVALDAARAGAMTAEVLAVTRIGDLLRRSPARVTLEAGWSGRAIPLPLPRGGAVARVVDGGNCFNLNGLVTRDPAGRFAANPAAVAAFARLVRLVGGNDGERVAAAAADWIDSDDTALPGGAEDPTYLGLPQPYRTAGTLMADRSELRAVSGVTADLYARLRPLVCALPAAGAATLNLNTLAPEQAPLLAAWDQGANVAALAGALSRRPPTGFADAGAFWQSAGTAAGTAPAGVTTTWFALTVEARIGDAQVEEHGLIDATRLPARLVDRQWGEAT